MSTIRDRMKQLGLVPAAALRLPPGAELPFPWVRVVGTRVLVSGHGPTGPDGTLAGPFGKVGAEVSPDQARHAASLTALAILGSLERSIGDLDRIAAWERVFGMVNVTPGFDRMPDVINGFTELIIKIFGAEVGSHARSAVGVASLPFGIPVEIEAELRLHD